jgi:hypothetical protein
MVAAKVGDEARRRRERAAALEALACRKPSGTGKPRSRGRGHENLRTASETARDFSEYLGESTLNGSRKKLAGLPNP